MEVYLEEITKVHIDDGYKAVFTLCPNPDIPEFGMILSYTEDDSESKDIYFPRALVSTLVKALLRYDTKKVLQ